MLFSSKSNREHKQTVSCPHEAISFFKRVATHGAEKEDLPLINEHKHALLDPDNLNSLKTHDRLLATLFNYVLEGYEIKVASDINQTLQDLNSKNLKLFPGVKKQLTNLLKHTNVIFISGDQGELIKERFIPTISACCEKKDLEKIKIFTETGSRSLRFINNNWEFKDLPKGCLSKDDFNSIDSSINKIKDKYAPILKRLLKNADYYKDLSLEQFKNPNNLPELPFFVQTPADKSYRSKELAIYSKLNPERRKIIKEILKDNTELSKLRGKIVTEQFSDFFTKLKVDVQASGVGTIDYRKFKKSDVIKHVFKVPQEKLLVVAFGDATYFKENDSSFSSVAQVVVDVGSTFTKRKYFHLPMIDPSSDIKSTKTFHLKLCPLLGSTARALKSTNLALMLKQELENLNF